MILRFLRQRWELLLAIIILFSVTIVHRVGPFVISHKDMANQSGPDIVAENSCFDGQRVPESERVALKATVFLYVKSADGQNAITGSGIVLRDSRTPDGHNRILTIRHLTQHALRTHGKIYVIDRFGRKLGEARQTPATILSDSRLAQEPDSAVPNQPGDNAVLLDVLPIMRNYDRISGVEIAPRLYREIMYGWFTDPASLMPGSSGAAVLNDQNQVIGIVEAVSGGDNIHNHAFATQLIAHDIMKVIDTQNSGEDTISSVLFFYSSMAAFMPVAGPGVQDILHLQPAFAPPENLVHVHIFGYPELLCIAYHGEVYPHDAKPMMGIPHMMHNLSGL